MRWLEWTGPCLYYHNINITPISNFHLVLQRQVTLIEFASIPYLFINSMCLVYMNMIAMFDEIPAITRYDIKKKNVTDVRMGIVKKKYTPPFCEDIKSTV